MATKEQKAYFDKLARYGCVLCVFLGYGEGTPAEIHHIRKAGQRKTSPVIPLCREHHRGDTGFHGLGRKSFEKIYGVTQDDLLEIIRNKF